MATLSAASQKILAAAKAYKTTPQPANISKPASTVTIKPTTDKPIPKETMPQKTIPKEKDIPKMPPTLSAATIKAQQALSEKFGIATFTTTGAVSTIPQTRPLDVSINVGSGSTGLSSNVLNQFLAKISPQQATVPTQTVVTGQGFQYQSPVSSPLVQGETILEQRNIQPSFMTTIQQYTPYIILGGLGLLALTLLKR